MDLQGRHICDHVLGDPAVLYSLNNCPRCKGLEVYGDIQFDTDGNLLTVELGDELIQGITKILTEHRRPTGYGFDYELFREVIGVDTASDLKAEVIRCLSYLKDMQNTSISEGRFYRASELLDTVESLVVEVPSTEPRSIIVKMDAVAVSGRAAYVELNLEL